MTQASRSKKRIIIIVVICATILFIAGAGYVGWSRHSVVDRATLERAEFPVYAPRSAPSGYELKSDSTQLSGAVLSYAFVDAKTQKEITVTVQGRPVGFDMSRITKEGNLKSSQIASGTLYDLTAGGVSRYLVDTHDALIFLTSNENIDATTMKQLADSLVRFR